MVISEEFKKDLIGYYKFVKTLPDYDMFGGIVGECFAGYSFDGDGEEISLVFGHEFNGAEWDKMKEIFLRWGYKLKDIKVRDENMIYVQFSKKDGVNINVFDKSVFADDSLEFRRDSYKGISINYEKGDKNFLVEVYPDYNISDFSEIELIAAQHGYYIYFVDDMWYDELGVRFAKEEL